MAELRLDHVNIRTPQVAETVAFFRDLLGMSVTPAPGVADMRQGAWIRDPSGVPAIHIGHVENLYPGETKLPPGAGTGSGRIHHVAMRCQGYEELRGRLEAAGRSLEHNIVDEIGLRQIFVEDPNGILVELNFFED